MAEQNRRMTTSSIQQLNTQFEGYPALQNHIDECTNPTWLSRHATWLPKNHVNVVAEIPGSLLEYPDPVMVKLFGWRNTISIIFSPVMRSRAKKSWDTARWLLNHGITTPKPIAVFTQRRYRVIKDNFYACQSVQSYQTAREILQDSSVHPDMKIQMVRELAEIVKQMHEGHLIHNDLTLANFLVKDYSKEDIYLVDLNRATHWKILPPPKRMADIARMDLCDCDYPSGEDHLCFRDIFLLRYSGDDYGRNRLLLQRLVRLRRRQMRLKNLRDLIRK